MVWFTIRNWKIVVPAAIAIVFLLASIIGFIMNAIIGGVMAPFTFFFGSKDDAIKTEIVQEYVSVGETHSVYWPDLAAYDYVRTEGTYEDISKSSILTTLETFSYYVTTCSEVQESSNGGVTTKNVCTKTRHLYSLDEVLSKEGKTPDEIEHARFISENMLSFTGEDDESNIPGGDVIIDPELVTNDAFIWPFPAAHLITSPFAHRINPKTGKPELHGGLDIANGRFSDPVIASADGTVIEWINDPNHGCGLNIKLKHVDGYQSRYCHMEKLEIKEKTDGQPTQVKKGQVIGYVGSTGQSTGAHLHYEIRKNGKKINPLPLVAKTRPKGG